MASTPFIRYEGCQVGVRGERGAAACWYVRHLGFEIVADSPDQTVLRHGERFGLCLVPVGSALWGDEPAFGMGTMQVTFSTGDLVGARETLVREGVRTGPLEEDRFAFVDGEGTQVVVVPAASPSAARLAGYGPLEIGVRDLARSLPWYIEHVGVEPLDADDRSILCTLGDFEPIRLRFVPKVGPDPLARPYLLALDLDAAHRFCTERGLTPSPIRGEVGALRLFHFRDPDGNRLGVWSYPQARQRLGD